MKNRLAKVKDLFNITALPAHSQCSDSDIVFTNINHIQ